jgi:hypothetical protein
MQPKKSVALGRTEICKNVDLGCQSAAEKAEHRPSWEIAFGPLHSEAPLCLTPALPSDVEPPAGV